MSKYSKLKQHLGQLHGETEWEASFQDIENILGFDLPPSAYKYQAWWSNQSGGHTQTASWLDAGWKTANLDLAACKVTFVRLASGDEANIPAERPTASVGISDSTRGLTISQAKLGLARAYGVPVESIEITIRG